MKNKLIKFKLIIFLFLFSRFTFCIEEKYVIGTQSWGFFACFFNTLNHIAFCEQNNKIPVVYWGKECPFYDEKIHNNKFNAWDSYFEPVSKLSYKSGDKINSQYLSDLPLRPVGTLFAIGSNRSGKFLARYQIKNFIDKYIKIKSSIKTKIDNFYKKYILNKPTIGIHLRGTDKKTECISVEPEKILEFANKNFKNYQFFIATDEEKLLELARKKLNGTVISYDSIRSKDGKPVHFFNNNKIKAGEDILIEAYLLASCNKFIHTSSNVSMAVLCLNPELENLVFPVRFIK